MLIDLNKQLNPSFKKVCDPLFNNFPVSAFVYMEHVNESDFFYLSTDLNWAQDYLENPTIPKVNLPFISQAFSQQQSVPQLGMPEVQAKEYAVFSKLNELGYAGFLNIYKKSNNRIKLWSFVCDDHQKSLDFLTTEKDIIEKFILHFEEKSNMILPGDNHIPTGKLINSMKIDLVDRDDLEIQKNRFLDSVKIKKVAVEHKGDFFLLSSREWECLKVFALGYSAKEIAEQFGISHRTVEQYLLSIRTKQGLV